ncbi:prolyl-tRNA synthetase domain protein [Clostridioides difficile 840]|nr:prolyl-tRNA synthetase domain protein [Clostridioides difficile 840]
MRITVGKNINEGKVEFKLRHKEDKEIIDIEEINEKVKAEFIRNNVRLG